MKWNMGETNVISVIIPVYNAEKYLSFCIDSILYQTFQSFEIILINDGSTDRSLQIAKKYCQKDARIKLISTENHGVGRARNTGLANASGKYIMFVDADDFLAANALEVLWTDIRSANADIAVGRVSSILPYKSIALKENGIEIWNTRKALFQFISSNDLIYGCVGKLYKASSIEGASFEEKRKIHEDGFFFLQCLLNASVVVAHDIVIYSYRTNMDSASHAAFSQKFYDILYFGTLEKEMIDQAYPELSDYTINIEICAKLSMLHAFCNTKGKKYRRDIKHCIQYVIKHKRFYIEGKNHEKKWFWLVTHHFYHLYKLAYRIKFPERIS